MWHWKTWPRTDELISWDFLFCNYGSVHLCKFAQSFAELVILLMFEGSWCSLKNWTACIDRTAISHANEQEITFHAPTTSLLKIFSACTQSALNNARACVCDQLKCATQATDNNCRSYWKTHYPSHLTAFSWTDYFSILYKPLNIISYQLNSLFCRLSLTHCRC